MTSSRGGPLDQAVDRGGRRHRPAPRCSDIQGPGQRSQDLAGHRVQTAVAARPSPAFGSALATDEVFRVSLDGCQRLVEVPVGVLTAERRMLVAEPDAVVRMPGAPDSLQVRLGAIFASSVAPKRTRVK
jgi:hypothetical protein